jgi:hypothetical protein
LFWKAVSVTTATSVVAVCGCSAFLPLQAAMVRPRAAIAKIIIFFILILILINIFVSIVIDSFPFAGE